MAATLVGGSAGGGGGGAGGPDEPRLTRIPIATAPRNATMAARIGATNNKPITARTRIRISHAYCVQPLPDGAVPVDGGGSLPVTTCVVCSSVAPPAAARGGAAEMRPLPIPSSMRAVLLTRSPTGTKRRATAPRGRRRLRSAIETAARGRRLDLTIAASVVGLPSTFVKTGEANATARSCGIARLAPAPAGVSMRPDNPRRSHGRNV